MKIVKGKVIKGGGQSVKRMEIGDTLQMLQEETKMDITPGTLNIRLDKYVVLKNGKILNKNLTKAEKKPFELYPCTLNGKKAYIIQMPLGYTSKRYFEIISDIHFRTELNLKDNDEIFINIDDEYITQQDKYYSQIGTYKKDFIYDFISKKNIKSIYDVGCKDGSISEIFHKKGYEVLGIDIKKTKVRIPFKKENVMDDRVRFNDCTFFLSLYHHLLLKYGLEKTDEIFFKLLLRCKYLIFDVGNKTEKYRKHIDWCRKMKFETEKELFDHFKMPYEKIGKWETGGGVRNVVVFKNREIPFKVIEKYKRKKGANKQKDGLIKEKDWGNDLFQETIFYKLKFKDKYYFGKKHFRKEMEEQEQENILKVYQVLSKENLLKYYGFSDIYGFIYEWIDNFIYKRKTNIIKNGISLKDVDIIEIDGKNKFIDFYR
jgi:SAM-dependent methyltransferase